MKRVTKYLTTVICAFSIMLCWTVSVFADETDIIDEYVLPPSTESAFVDEPINVSTPQASVDPIRMLKLRVMLGTSYRNDEDNSAKDITYLDIPFKAIWRIGFTPSYTNIINLPIDKCTLGIDTKCSDTICGSNCTNSTNTYIHHRNAVKNIQWIINSISSTGYDIMLTLVSSKMCRALDDGTHDTRNILGIAQSDGTYALANGASSRNQTARIRTMQHEISHLFGCRDSQCADGEKCIMNGGYYNESLVTSPNIWCSNCKKAFNPSLH